MTLELTARLNPINGFVLRDADLRLGESAVLDNSRKKSIVVEDPLLVERKRRIEAANDPFNRLRVNFGLLKSGKNLHINVVAQMIGEDLRRLNVTPEEMREVQTHSGDLFSSISKHYERATLLGKARGFSLDSMEKSAKVWSGVSRLAKTGASWIESRIRDFNTPTSVTVDGNKKPNLSARIEEKPMLVPVSYVIGGAVVGTAGVVTLTAIAGGMYLESLWKQPSAPVAPKVASQVATPKLISPPAEIYESVSSTVPEEKIVINIPKDSVLTYGISSTVRDRFGRSVSYGDLLFISKAFREDTGFSETNVRPGTYVFSPSSNTARALRIVSRS